MTTDDIPDSQIEVEVSEDELDEEDELVCDLWQDIQGECEPLDKYATAGRGNSQAPLFYPIEIGQRLHNGRYHVVHRLGHGGFSTVWMARDTKGAAAHAAAVALKVTANVHVTGTNDSVNGDWEYEMHKLIQASGIDKSHLLLCQDAFTLRAPHGDHRVLVLPLAEPGLESLSVIPRMRVTGRPLQHRMLAAQQLLGAVESLHQAGLVHNDISTGNVLWKIKPKFNRRLAQNPDIMGQPRKIGFKTRWKGKDGKPGTLSGDRVLPAKFVQESLDNKVFLSDFGITTKAGTSVANKIMGVQRFVSPERFHDHDPSPASDMWSFMVVFIYLYNGRYPFQGSFFSAVPADFVRDMVDSLGPLSSEWAEKKFGSFENEWHRGAGSSQFPRPEKTFQSQLRLDLTELEERAAAEGDHDGALARDIELKRRAEPHVLKTIDRAFRYDPQERITASELLHDFDWKMLMKICGVDDRRHCK